MTEPTTAELPLDADLLALRELQPFVHGFLERAGREDVQSRLDLALHEVCVNVVQHAYAGGPGRLHLLARSDGRRVTVTVRDQGMPFDPDSAPEPVPGQPQIHGYGLSIARQLLDHLTYTRTEGVNTWLLELDL